MVSGSVQSFSRFSLCHFSLPTHSPTLSMSLLLLFTIIVFDYHYYIVIILLLFSLCVAELVPRKPPAQNKTKQKTKNQKTKNQKPKTKKPKTKRNKTKKNKKQNQKQKQKQTKKKKTKRALRGEWGDKAQKCGGRVIVIVITIHCYYHLFYLLLIPLLSLCNLYY